MMRTTAPGNGAPVTESRTVPVTATVRVPWANSTPGMNQQTATTAARNARIRRLLR